MKKTRTFLNAMGMVNALGASVSEIREKLYLGSNDHIQKESNFIPDETVCVARVTSAMSEIPKELSEYDSRNDRLLMTAYEQIKDSVQAQIEKYGAHRVGVVLGSSTSGVLETEEALNERKLKGSYLKDYSYLKQEMGTVSEFIAKVSKAEGIAYTISTACSSSAKVFGSAKSLIEMGICDAVITGGADSLCKLTLNGFWSLESVSKDKCNPMSKNRSGLTIGEAAALFVLTKDESKIELLGVGESSDAYHISSPEPEGLGVEQAVKKALADASLKPEDIDYINLHGTGTEKNDSMESRAMKRIFGSETPCSSTKSLVGHTLGAAGATETGFLWLSLGDEDRLPPHVYDNEYDDTLPKIRLVSVNEKIAKKTNRRYMSNSFAFGGNNCCVIIGENNGI
ncbi:MAG: beta-ketoacyl-[acyl-carrier-protein] synthase family protein [Spirochaetia bacterium]|nr:beta-ketoacyl-[acyl-carrier-protein] synthase family protein [Spirochaetia bacterium]